MLDLNDEFRFQKAIDLFVEAGGVADRDTIWLDLGCHQGQFLKKVIAEYSARGIGFDAWDAAAKSEADSGWEYRTVDLDRELPWSEPADVISAFEVLEHMIDTDGFLKRVYERLKPGGRVLVSTPNINSLRNRVLVPFGVYPGGLEYRTVIHHVRLYNAHVLRKHLEETGFEDVTIWGIALLPMRFPMGRSRASARLARAFPSLCANLLAIGRK